MSESYIEKLPLRQIETLARSARRKLSILTATRDHNLRYIVGHAMLLDVIEMEIERRNHEKEASEAAERTSVLIPRTTRISNSSKIAIAELSVTRANTLSTSGIFGLTKGFNPVRAFVLAQKAFAMLATVESIASGKNVLDEPAQLQHIYKHLIYLAELLEECDDENSSDSSSGSDSLGSEEDWN